MLSRPIPPPKKSIHSQSWQDQRDPKKSKHRTPQPNPSLLGNKEEASKHVESAPHLHRKTVALNPRIKPAPSALFIILLKTSIITRNNIGDSGSPYLKPLELPKKSAGDPLNKTENWTVKMQVRIHLHHLTPNPILFNKSRSASQFT